LARRDLLAAAIDDLLEPPVDGEIAISIHDAEIASMEPAMAEGLGIGGGAADIAGGHVLAADHDVAGLARRQPPPAIVHDRELGPGGAADAAGPPPLRWRRGARPLMGRP